MSEATWPERPDRGELGDDGSEPPAPVAVTGETERERQLHGLAVLSLFLHSTATIQEMMSLLLDQASKTTGAILVYPLLLERRRQLLRASILEGAQDEQLDAAMDAFQEDLIALEFPLVNHDELRRILDEGEVVLKDGLEVLVSGVLAPEQVQSAQEALGIAKVAFVPMVVEGEALGLVIFAFDSDEIDIEALELLVGHLTLALRDLLMRDEAVRFSDVDPLTWVYNRRHLAQQLESEIARAGRYGRTLSLVAIDIDDLGVFNETYGQSLGDRLLRTVATTLAEAVTPPEFVARVRDDDFVVVLPETSRATAVTSTTRLLASLAGISIFDDDANARPVTVSVAISCFPEDAGTARELLLRAQADLDAAKQERPGVSLERSA